MPASTRNPLHGRERLQEIAADAGAMQEHAVGPTGVAVHAAQQHGPLAIEPGIEGGVQFFDLGPESQGNAADFEDIALQATLGFSSCVRKSRQFLYRPDVVFDVRRDQVDPAFYRVAVGIDETREQGPTLQVDAFGPRAGHVGDIGQISDGHDPVAADGHGVGIRIFGIAREDLRVKKDSFGGKNGGGRDEEQRKEAESHGRSLNVLHRETSSPAESQRQAIHWDRPS